MRQLHGRLPAVPHVRCHVAAEKENQASLSQVAASRGSAPQPSFKNQLFHDIPWVASTTSPRVLRIGAARLSDFHL